MTKDEQQPDLKAIAEAAVLRIQGQTHIDEPLPTYLIAEAKCIVKEAITEAVQGYVSERDAAYGYLSRLFLACAPQCEVLPTLTGVATQIDNYIVGLQQELSEARAEIARMRTAANQFANSEITAGKLAEELCCDDKHGFKCEAGAFAEPTAAEAEILRLTKELDDQLLISCRVQDERCAQVTRAEVAEQREQALREENVRLKEDADDSDRVRQRMNDLLSQTAVALKGPEPPLTRWSWHDVPELAMKVVADLQALRDGLRALQPWHFVGMYDEQRCFFCDVSKDTAEHWAGAHAEDCMWANAQADALLTAPAASKEDECVKWCADAEEYLSSLGFDGPPKPSAPAATPEPRREPYPGHVVGEYEEG